MTNKKSTIGDIANLKTEEKKILSMLDIIKGRVDNHRGDEYINLNINEEFRLDDIEEDRDLENPERKIDEQFLTVFEDLISV